MLNYSDRDIFCTDSAMTGHHRLSTGYAAFVPGFVRKEGLECALGSQPFRRSQWGAAVFADISGFTARTEQALQSEPDGAEMIGRLVDRCFGRLTSLVSESGGDVVHFAGDAILAVWTSSTPHHLAEMTIAAARTALRLDVAIAADEALAEEGIRLRVGIGAGELWTACVGGEDDRWYALAAGPAVAGMKQASRQAQPGQVLASRSAWELVASAASGEPAPGSCVRVDWVQPATAGISFQPAGAAQLLDEAPALLRFVPQSLQAKLEAGLADWLGELRTATSMFVTVEGVNCASTESWGALQNAVTNVQRAVYEQGGSINQAVVDDKGLSILAAWGISLHTHEDDAVRAVRAAIEIQRRLQGMGCSAQIGIATGPVYAGLRGSPSRCDYGLIGDVVNLSARLTTDAATPAVCDASTRTAARGLLAFEALEPVRLKGKATAVKRYRPLGERTVDALGRSRPHGRTYETGRIASRIRALSRNREGGALVIQGEPGIGKSRLVQHLIGLVAESTLRVTVGVSDSIRQAVPYHPWTAPLQKLLGIEDLSAEERCQKIRLAIPSSEDVDIALSLLSPILGLERNADGAIHRMTSQSRAERTVALLALLVQASVSEAPSVIVLEDAHWMDSSSWELGTKVLQAGGAALLVITTRPVAPGASPTSRSKLLGSPRVETLNLGALQRDEVLAIASERLDADALPAAVSDFIVVKAEGHPLFTEQLAFALRDRGLIRVEAGECSLVSSRRELEAFSLTASVHGVVTSRIDLLTPAQQLTLKVASVAGRAFDADTLRKIHPLRPDAEALMANLEAIRHLGLLLSEDDSYRFSHSITQDVAESLLPSGQRRELHAAMANLLESRHPEVPPSLYAPLAHHWTQAKDGSKALRYLSSAARESLSNHANSDAVRLLVQALAICRERQGRPTPPQRLEEAAICCLLGEAQFHSWDWVGATQRFVEGLRLYGHPSPQSRAGRLALLVREISIQMLNRAGVVPRRKPGGSGDSSQLGAAHAAGLLGQSMMQTVDSLGILMTSFQAANLGERAGVPSPLALGIIGLAAGAFGVKPLADRYFQRAREGEASAADVKPYVNLAHLEICHLVGQGRLADAERRCTDALAMGHEAGYRTGNAATISGLTNLKACCGCFGEMHLLAQSAWESIRDEPAGELRYYLLLGHLHADCWLLRPEEACVSLDVIRSRMKREARAQALQERVTCGFAAKILAGAGRITEALVEAESSLEGRLNNPRSVPPILWFSFDGALEAYLAAASAWKTSRPAEAAVAMRKAGRTLRALRLFARLYPIAWARYFYYLGLFLAEQGDTAKARKNFKISLEWGEKLNLPIDSSLARVELARSAQAGSLERQNHLQIALATFQTSKVPHWIDQIQALLG